MLHLNKKREEADPAVAQARVRVEDGFHPAIIHAVAGRPLRITFRREESSPCSERVVFPALGESRMLPTGEDVNVELVPEAAGELEFTCEMGMLRGRLIVEPPIPAAAPAA